MTVVTFNQNMLFPPSEDVRYANLAWTIAHMPGMRRRYREIQTVSCIFLSWIDRNREWLIELPVNTNQLIDVLRVLVDQHRPVVTEATGSVNWRQEGF
jgi:hypothetical protein